MNMMNEISSIDKIKDEKLDKNANSNETKINNNCNLIVNYLPQSLKEHDFNLLFSKIGPLKTCKLMFDRQTGKLTPFKNHH